MKKHNFLYFAISLLSVGILASCNSAPATSSVAPSSESAMVSSEQEPSEELTSEKESSKELSSDEFSDPESSEEVSSEEESSEATTSEEELSEEEISSKEESSIAHQHEPGPYKHDDTNHWRECGSCDELLGLEEHKFDAGVITKGATHTATGEKTYTCSVCGYQKIEEVAKLSEHTFGQWTSISETQHQRSCACGEVEKADHAFNDGVITKQPTHLEKGEKTYTCSVCGYEKKEELAKLEEHTFGEWTSISETQHQRSCACGEVEKADHAFNDGVITKQPTHLEKGEKTYTCSVCGYEKKEELAKLSEHTYNWVSLNDNQHKGTCACSDEIIENHIYGEAEIYKAATRTEKGISRKTCKCGHYVDEEIDIVTTNILIIGTGNINNYNMDQHLNGLAAEAGYKDVTAEYVTLSSNYSFRKMLDTTEETSFGSRINALLEANEYDVIIVAVPRLVTKGSDDVIAAETAYLAEYKDVLLAETNEIYLMTFNIDWNTTPKHYEVNGDGDYVENGSSTYDHKETSRYFDTIAEGWAESSGFKLMKYASCYVNYRESNSVSANTVAYIQGVLLYNSIFNKEVASNSQYHKNITSSFKDTSAANIRTYVLPCSTYVAPEA